MVANFGLTHIALAVKDPVVSMKFYEAVFGLREYYRDDNTIQAQGPGKDVIAFERDPDRAGRAGGIAHFGFRLKSPDDIGAAVQAVIEAGGTILSQGEFSPGYPFAFAKDPDGYAIEIWFE